MQGLRHQAVPLHSLRPPNHRAPLGDAHTTQLDLAADSPRHHRPASTHTLDARPPQRHPHDRHPPSNHANRILVCLASHHDTDWPLVRLDAATRTMPSVRRDELRAT